MIKPAMSSTSIVEVFDVLKDCGFSLYMTSKRLNNVEELTLKSSEEALRHRIVIAVPHRAHRDLYLELIT